METVPEAWVSRIARVPPVGSKRAARTGLDRLRARAIADGVTLEAFLACEPIRGLLQAAIAASPYLTDLIVADPTRLERLLVDGPDQMLETAMAACGSAPFGDEPSIMRALRLAKQQVALSVALADLGKVWSTMDITAALARFADCALDAAVNHALAGMAARGKIRLPASPDPQRQSGLIVLAMGKHGAFELNYSSDIDLIVFFDPARAAPLLADPDEPTDFFVRLTQIVVRVMQSVTPDGYVFRTDLRLRPDPGSTPIAISTDAAMQYYGSVGQNWERAALIKARPAAGDIVAGQALLDELKPFIWRKSFDFAAIADVHSIKRQIHAAKGYGEITIAGHDVKLGRGGIREIEFFVQTQQLIAGGRNPALRGRSTLAMLDALVAADWIAATVRDDLRAAYLFLRDVEHRIQMVADQQTHRLPEDAGGLRAIAAMMGFPRLRGFERALLLHLTTVQRHYAHLFEQSPVLSSGDGSLVFTGGENDPATLETLTRMGFHAPAAICEAIRAWHFSRYNATRSTVARERLTELTPTLLKALAATGQPDDAFRAFDRFVAGLPAGVQIFSLLASQPALLSLLAEILGGAVPRLADTLTRRPRVMDALIDRAFFGAMARPDEIGRQIDTLFADARSYEDCLDRVRIMMQERTFLIGVRVLTGTASTWEASQAYADLADTIIDRLFARVAAEMAEVHGVIEGGGVAIVAMGKLGGREMTATSDLDLMLLYDAPDPLALSTGSRPLVASQFYARLAQRLVTALSAPTAEGQLYAVDFRLRPSGNKGPLATSLSSFTSYQATEAWTWEHMALTRARVVTGTAQMAQLARSAIRSVFRVPRDAAKLRADVREMRGLLEAEKATDDIWDIKQVPGGLIDIEFIAQYLTLRQVADDMDVLSTRTAKSLDILAKRGYLPAEAAAMLIPAESLYATLTQVLRLAQSGPFVPDEASPRLCNLLASTTDLPSFSALEAHLRATLAEVRAAFIEIVGAPIAP
jgi:glutamate-ammonia-ligase adenylyltransferase